MDDLDRILIVDDDESSCRTLSLIFGKNGYETDTAVTGREALEKAQQRRFGVALLDIMLPDQHGLELIPALKGICPETAVIMITAFASLESAVKALNEGASAYITKPLNMDEVLLTVREALKKQQLVAENRRLLKAAQTELAERKRAEEVLRQSEARYRELYDGAPVGYHEIDREGRIVRVNQTEADLLGYTVQEMTGRAVLDFFPPDQRDLAKTAIQEKLEGRRPPAGFEAIYLCKDGRTIHAYIEDRLITDNEGRTIGLRSAVQDVSKRKRAEEGERLATRVLELLNSSGEKTDPVREVLLLIKDFGGFEAVGIRLKQDEDFPYYDTRGFPTQFVGAETKLCVRDESGKPVSDPQQKPRLEGMCGRVISGKTDPSRPFFTEQGTFWTNNARQLFASLANEESMAGLRRRCTAMGYESVALIPLRCNGETVGLLQLNDKRKGMLSTETIGLFEGVGASIGVALARKRAQEALEQERLQLARRVEERTADLSLANMELARTARMKDEFFANMSHELRTPLNAILGMSEALRDGVYGSTNERQRRSLDSVEQSGRHLLSLINDILDVSKMEAGELEIETAQVSVRSVCQASLGLVKQEAQKKGLKVVSQLDGSVETVQADERRLKQILVNLLSNAVKFTPEGGKIGIEVDGDKDKRVVHLTVWDTGVGIPSEDMPRLFRPFVQLDSKLSRQHRGTGLGLCLVRRLADLHGGGVSVTSEVGKGSRFTVSLPWVGSPQQGAGAQPELQEEIPALRIGSALVIEDSSASADQLCRYVATLGAQPTVYSRGAGAVDKVVEVQPDVVILDVLLPDVPGWNVLEQLKGDPQTKDVPVVVVSVVDDRPRAIALGAAEYLVKPISLQQLAHAFEEVLGDGQPSREAVGRARSTPGGPESRPQILLAEDNEDNINTISDYLLAKGYRVAIARNGGEAVDRATEERPDLIVMDIQMPGMDGLEATRRIRSNQELTGVPIIALTALAMPGDRERCLEAGADEYLGKPVSLKGLVGEIEKQLASTQPALRADAEVVDSAVGQGLGG